MDMNYFMLGELFTDSLQRINNKNRTNKPKLINFSHSSRKDSQKTAFFICMLYITNECILSTAQQPFLR